MAIIIHRLYALSLKMLLLVRKTSLVPLFMLQKVHCNCQELFLPRIHTIQLRMNVCYSGYYKMLKYPSFFHLKEDFITGKTPLLKTNKQTNRRLFTVCKTKVRETVMDRSHSGITETQILRLLEYPSLI